MLRVNNSTPSGAVNSGFGQSENMHLCPKQNGPSEPLYGYATSKPVQENTVAKCWVLRQGFASIPFVCAVQHGGVCCKATLAGMAFFLFDYQIFWSKAMHSECACKSLC